MVPADGPSYIAGLIEKLCLGGIFLLGHWQDQKQLARMLAAVHEATPNGLSAIIATDHEGGQIQNLRTPNITRIPSAASLSKGTVQNAKRVSALGAKELAGIGVHMIFSPVADVVDPRMVAKNRPIARHDRGFGTDPAKVGPFVEAVIRGHRSAGIISTVKHFPGIGRITEDTDHRDNGITDPWTTDDDDYLSPFSAAFRIGCEAVMIASAYYTRIDPDNLALFSRKIMVDILRGKLGYQGLIVADDLGSSVSVFGVPVRQRARKHIEAGGDLAITANPEQAGAMVEETLAWSNRSEAAAARLRDAATRVLTVKVAHELAA